MQVYTDGTVLTSLVGLRKSSCIMISLAGCDFNCPDCSDNCIKEFKEEYLQTILNVKKEITENVGVSEYVFFGGAESCLQRQALLALSRHAKTAKLKVGLKTHGTKPDTLRSMFNQNLLDMVEFSIRSKFEEETFEKITKSKNFFKTTDSILQSIYDSLKLLKKVENKVDIVFKTKLIVGLNDSEEALLNIAHKIQDIRSTLILLKTSDIPHQKAEILKEAIENKYPQMIIEIEDKLDDIEEESED